MGLALSWFKGFLHLSIRNNTCCNKSSDVSHSIIQPSNVFVACNHVAPDAPFFPVSSDIYSPPQHVIARDVAPIRTTPIHPKALVR